ncbi:MAG: DUF2683 family protein [Flavobacteriales bacterium AspAUS03]
MSNGKSTDRSIVMGLILKNLIKRNLGFLLELAKELKIEMRDSSKLRYDLEFVVKIKQGEEKFKSGKGVKIALVDL